ncbi:MAG: AAA family ATPase, partial [Stellaceae bacterium]
GVCGTVVSRLQLEFRGLVRLQAIFWENELLRADQTFQSQIPRACESDACIFILWSWFGTPLSAAVACRPDGTTYVSGTEFEFEDAMTSRRTRGTPDIFVYRKVADVPVSVRSRDVELMQRSQRDALDGFLDKWFRGEGGTFKAAFYEFEHPAGFERLLETHLRRWIIEALEKAGVAAAAVHREAQWKGSPFRGLRPFDIDDALIFCGRTQAVTELLDLLRGRAAAGRPFALVVGRSGAGKSSLTRAGLLPMLTQPEVIQGVIAWRRAVFRPSDATGRPMDALAAAILSQAALPEIAAGGTDAAELAKLLGENPAASAPLIRLALAGVGDTARAALPPGSEGVARLALVIDQFEEIFTQEGVQSADRGAFVAALHALAGSGHVWIVATMRADFYPRCQDLPAVFLELCPREAVFELMPPTPEEISQMIRRPARLAGLDFEKRADQEQGLDDVLRDAAIANPGSLPLLQFALEELYTRAGQGRLLRFADYEEMGRLPGALQVRAETELNALPEDAQAALPLVLSHLVQLDLKTGAIVQRRLSYARVAADPHCRALIDSFVDKRLFESDRGSDGETVVGVAHEALLRSWMRAREWIEHNQAFLRLRARIGAAGVLWQEEGRPARLLLPEGQGLKDALRLKAERGAELGGAELAYIDQSLALARRARGWRRIRALAAGIMVAMLSAAGGWYYWAYVMPLSAYYEDYEMRWGFPEGRRIVSADIASHRKVTYKLTRRGALGHVVKIESLNGSDKCTQTNEGDTPFGESPDNDYTSKTQCSVEFQET